MKPTYNRILFDYGFEGEGLQEIVNGHETRLLSADGEPLNLPEAYGYDVIEQDIASPANAPDIETAASQPQEAPAGFTYILVPDV